MRYDLCVLTDVFSVIDALEEKNRHHYFLLLFVYRMLLANSMLANIVHYNNLGNCTFNYRYQAHSDNDVLVLLDVTPDQSMIDEGVARELVNRVQKLRKKVRSSINRS